MRRTFSFLVFAAALTAAISATAGAQASVLNRPAVSGPVDRVARPSVTGVPVTPFLEAVVPEGLAALVSWTPSPPADQVTGYTLTAAVAKGYGGPVGSGCAAPPATTAPASDSSALASGLCAQVPYTVTVTAANSAGTSPRSNRSNPVVPLVAQPPSTPLLGTVTAREQSLVVTWTPPALPGGAPLTGYVLSATAGSQTVTIRPGPSATHAVVTGLTDGTTYQVSLAAFSAAGTSASVHGSGTPSPPYRPGQPQSLQVAPSGSGRLAVSWQAPVDAGGDAITGYAITYQQEVPAGGGTWTPTGTPTTITVGPSARTRTISSVGAKKFYSVSVAAVSAAGTGQAAITSTPVSPTTNLAPGAVLLTAATMTALASDTAGTLTWPAPAPAQIQALSAGNVVVGPAAAAAPQGLLAKVVAVSVDGSGGYLVQTTIARLTDAFANLAVAESGQPAQLQSARFTPTIPGARILSSRNVTFQKTITFGLSLQGGPNNRDSVGLALSVTPEVSFDMQIIQGFAGIPDGISVAASASVAAQLNVTASLTGTAHSWEFGTLKFPPIPIGPLEVTPTIPLVLDASGTISVGVSASLAIGAGMSWTSSDPSTLTTQNLSQPFQLTGSPLPGVAASASAQLTLKVPVGLLIYGIGGPDIEADGGLQATVNFNPPPGTPWFKVGPFVTCKIGFLFNFSLGPLSYDNGINITLATEDFPAFTIGSPPDADLTISPANPTVTAGKSLTLTATRSDGQSFAVSWALQGAEAGDSITSGGVLTVAAPAGRELTVVAFDSQGAQGQTTVTVGGESDPPANVRGTAGTDGKSATISWKPPPHTGGYLLATYTVVTAPATTTITVPATITSAHLTGLALGTLYQISVYATNNAGLTSPPGTAELATPLPGTLTGLTAQQAPLPVNAAANQQVSLKALACPAAGSCIAVGSYVTKAGPSAAIIETEVNGSWQPTEAPLPSGGSGPAYLAGVACPSTTSCVAVGGYDQGFLIERLSGATWTPTAAPLPPNTNFTYGGPDVWTVACPSEQSCVAVADYFDTNLHIDLLVETLSGSIWTPTTIPLPANAASGTFIDFLNTGLPGLACPTTSTCVAVGTYVDNNNVSQILALTLSGGTWISAEAPLPANATTMFGFSAVSLPSLSCASTTLCVAVGFYVAAGSEGGRNGLIEEFSNGVWTATEAPLPPNAESPQYSLLNAVSCTGPGSCIAAGTYAGFENRSSDQPPLIETLANGNWTPRETATPTNGGDGVLEDLSCANIGCMVLGIYNPMPNTQELFVQSFSAGPPIQAPLPANANATPNPTPTSNGLACLAGAACTAIGTYTDTSNNTQGLIEAFGMAQP